MGSIGEKAGLGSAVPRDFSLNAAEFADAWIFRHADCIQPVARSE
jgi:hypothetical protein